MRFFFTSKSSQSEAILLLLLFSSSCSVTRSNSNNGLLDELERIATELRDGIEGVFNEGNQRCDALQTCANSIFDDCNTRLPQPSCLGGSKYANPSACECGGGNEALYDWTESTIRISPHLDISLQGVPDDKEAVESICLHSEFNEVFQRVTDNAQGRHVPVAMFFGSNTGVFHIYPGRSSQQCRIEGRGTYDTRERPWFVAGSSGPKTVVMVLDFSGSLYQYDKYHTVKQAAKRVVATTTAFDAIGLVTFHATATARGGGTLLPATQENKQLLIEEIDNLRLEDGASEGTNYLAGFEAAFDMLDASADGELFTQQCNTAILFFSDGELNAEGVVEQNVTDLVQTRLEQYQSLTENKPVYLFTYNVDEDDTYPADLACSVELGTWSKMSSVKDVVNSLSSYYELFALGRAATDDRNDVVWVEPYEYATGNLVGSTVSLPVYSTDGVFLGVVGVDVILDEIPDDSALFHRIYRPACHEIRLSPCQLDFFTQSQSSGASTVNQNCHANCEAEIGSIAEYQPCGDDSKPALYPDEIFANTELLGLPAEERLCCCAAPASVASNTGMLVGIIVGVVVLLALIAFGIFYYRRWKQKRRAPIAIAETIVATPQVDVRQQQISIPRHDLPVAERIESVAPSASTEGLDHSSVATPPPRRDEARPSSNNHYGIGLASLSSDQKKVMSGMPEEAPVEESQVDDAIRKRPIGEGEFVEKTNPSTHQS